jgi:hypothetical protein
VDRSCIFATGARENGAVARRLQRSFSELRTRCPMRPGAAQVKAFQLAGLQGRKLSLWRIRSWKF